MDTLTIISWLILISAVFSYFNARILKLPGTIGVMTVALLVSLVILIIGKTDKGIGGLVTNLTSHIDFSGVLLNVMLGFLLFASALHFDLNKLKEQRIAVFILSTVGVLISTTVFSILLYFATTLAGITLPLMDCFLFGALISPTDPIAVNAILKKSRIPERLNVIITGESMFNDAVGLILFVTLRQIADVSVANPTASQTLHLLGQEVVGGLVIGLVLGYLGFKLIQSIHDMQTILLISVGLVFGISLLAVKFHASVPLAVVAAGLVIGNANFGPHHPAHRILAQVWELLDEVLNTILFVMIGLQLVVLPFLDQYWLIGLISIAAILIARLASIILPASLILRRISFGNLTILTWAGLRGGISVAMALSIPASEHREQILAACYFVVLFSVLVQGLTLGKVVNAVTPAEQ